MCASGPIPLGWTTSESPGLRGCRTRARARGNLRFFEWCGRRPKADNTVGQSRVAAGPHGRSVHPNKREALRCDLDRHAWTGCVLRAPALTAQPLLARESTAFSSALPERLTVMTARDLTRAAIPKRTNLRPRAGGWQEEEKPEYGRPEISGITVGAASEMVAAPHTRASQVQSPSTRAIPGAADHVQSRLSRSGPMLRADGSLPARGYPPEGSHDEPAHPHPTTLVARDLSAAGHIRLTLAAAVGGQIFMKIRRRGQWLFLENCQ